MRKHRKWWMGFGLGIALGAMMLQLIAFAQEQPVLIADGEKTYTQQQLDEAVEEAIRQLPPPPASSEPPSGEPGGGSASPTPGPGAGGTAPAGTGPADTGPAPDPGALTGSGDGENPERIVAFYVNPGMSLSAVARSLKALGVIGDADDFIQAARPISKLIEVGTASFNGQPGYDEIIAELTRPKDD